MEYHHHHHHVACRNFDFCWQIKHTQAYVVLWIQPQQQQSILGLKIDFFFFLRSTIKLEFCISLSKLLLMISHRSTCLLYNFLILKFFFLPHTHTHTRKQENIVIFFACLFEKILYRQNQSTKIDVLDSLIFCLSICVCVCCVVILNFCFSFITFYLCHVFFFQPHIIIIIIIIMNPWI